MYPTNLDELVNSFTLYQMMTEMDATFFPMLPPQLLKLDSASLRKDKGKLKEVYDRLLSNLENWFSAKMENEINFDSEQISLKRLFNKNDTSELLFLLEYILIVAVKGEGKDNMIECILSLNEEAQTDLQTLIERALGMAYKGATDVEYESMSETIGNQESIALRPSMLSEANSEKEHGDVNDKINKVVNRLLRKKKLMQEKLIDLEVDNDLLNGLLVDKETELYNLKIKNEQLQKQNKLSNS